MTEEQKGTAWPLSWRGLPPRARPIWWQQLWSDAISLRDRYRLNLRSGWWQDDIQVEALAAFSAWTNAYDSGAWNDPPGKLQLLYDLERIRALLRPGQDVFDPERDRVAFEQHLTAIEREQDQRFESSSSSASVGTPPSGPPW
jgi:hypothetical protein